MRLSWAAFQSDLPNLLDDLPDRHADHYEIGLRGGELFKSVAISVMAPSVWAASSVECASRHR